MIDQTNLVVQTNPLVAAQYKLNEAEQKLLRVLVSMIKPDTPGLSKKYYKITIQDFAAFLGHKDESSLRSDMKRIARSLRETRVRVIKSDMTIETSWVAAFRYPKNKGYIEFEISSMLESELLRVKAEFTQYYLANIAKLTGSYTIRIYELIRQFLNTRQAKRVIDLDTFRGILGIQEGEYSDTSNMFRRVIKPAQREIIKKTDITFEWRPVKESRKIVGIEFYNIWKQTQIPASVMSLIPKKYRERKRVLREVTNWIELKGIDYVTEKLNYVVSKNPNNYSNYLYTVLAKNYGEGYQPPQDELPGIKEAVDFVPGLNIEYKGQVYKFDGMGLKMPGGIMPIGEMRKKFEEGSLKIIGQTS
ncbi:MAG: hypothetical protein NAOJABEB_02939 [Steroidobacteraceae bacterium]|jgi:plasmid replication initiation protein|nr:hypothetical protein [Steroidobacteraceae bacterium]HOA10647.1 replication initiation protein [Tenuifilaceae bacterium]